MCEKKRERKNNIIIKRQSVNYVEFVEFCIQTVYCVW